MWDEWVDVLARPHLVIEPERQAQILAQTRALVTLLADVPPPFERRFAARIEMIRCLLMRLCTAWTGWISKDQALRLRNRARQWGGSVVSPQDWLKSVTGRQPPPCAISVPGGLSGWWNVMAMDECLGYRANGVAPVDAVADAVV